MLLPEQTVAEFAIPAIDVRSLMRRAALPALLAAAAVAGLLLAGGRLHAFADAIRRILHVNGGWVATAAVFECISLAGYVALLALVAGRATARVRARESAQITLAGAAATRLLPTAGAGGAGLTLWALRRAGLGSRAATRTLLAFLVLLYAVFLASIVLSGVALLLGVASAHGPMALSLIPAAAALGCIALALWLAARHCEDDDVRGSRLRRGAHLLGGAVRDACRHVGAADVRLVGAIGYWMFDAAVLWAMLHAFGSPPALAVVALAYLVGQVANTLPLPGSVSGGIAGVLIAFGVSAELALPAVLSYRTIAVWLPTPVAIAALPGLRSTVARWSREDSATHAPVAQ